MKQDNTTWLAMAALFMSALLWGSSFMTMKFAFRHFDPMVVLFSRMFLGSVGFLFFIGGLKRIQYRKGDWKYILIIGLCEPCLYFVFEAMALENTTSAQAGMITAILPLMVAVAAGIFLKERTSRQTLIGFVLAIVGVCWLSLTGEVSETAPNPLLGNIYECIAMACATGYMIILRSLGNRYPSVVVAGFQAFIGCLFFLPFLFFPSTTLPARFEPLPVAAVIYLGIFVTLGAYACFNYGLSRIPAGQAAAFVNLIPVVAVILGWQVLGEAFVPEQYLASALILIGVCMSQRRKKPRVAVNPAG